MKMRKLLPLFASLMLCFGASALQAQTTPPAPSAPPPPTFSAPPPPDEPQGLALMTQGGNFLGVLPEEVTRENMGRYSLQEARGVAVTKVIEESPAARAGLKEGDVILRFEGEPVNSVAKLERLINEAGPEQTMRLTISRQGREQEVSVKLSRRKGFPTIGALPDGNLLRALPQGEMLRALPQNDALRGLMEKMPKGENLPMIAFGPSRRIGIGTSPLTKQLADYFGVTSGRGVLVTSVNEGSPAARAGLKAGDVITEVDGQAVENALDLSRALNRQKERDVSLSIIRDKHQRTIKVTPEKSQAVPFAGPEELIMPQIGRLNALPRLNFPRVTLPALPNIQTFRLAPRTTPNIKLIRPL